MNGKCVYPNHITTDKLRQKEKTVHIMVLLTQKHPGHLMPYPDSGIILVWTHHDKLGLCMYNNQTITPFKVARIGLPNSFSINFSVLTIGCVHVK